MKALGYLNIKSKTGKFIHTEEKHNNDAICPQCGALFCMVGGCNKWQEQSFSDEDYEKLPRELCEFCK